MPSAPITAYLHKTCLQLFPLECYEEVGAPIPYAVASAIGTDCFVCSGKLAGEYLVLPNSPTNYGVTSFQEVRFNYDVIKLLVKSFAALPTRKVLCADDVTRIANPYRTLNYETPKLLRDYPIPSTVRVVNKGKQVQITGYAYLYGRMWQFEAHPDGKNAYMLRRTHLYTLEDYRNAMEKDVGVSSHDLATKPSEPYHLNDGTEVRPDIRISPTGKYYEMVNGNPEPIQRPADADTYDYPPLVAGILPIKAPTPTPNTAPTAPNPNPNPNATATTAPNDTTPED